MAPTFDLSGDEAARPLAGAGPPALGRGGLDGPARPGGGRLCPAADAGPKTFRPGDPANAAAVVRGEYGQTAYLQEWRDGNGVLISGVDQNAHFFGSGAFLSGVAVLDGANYFTHQLLEVGFGDGLLAGGVGEIDVPQDAFE